MKSQEDRERAFWNRFARFLREFGVSEVSIRNQTNFAKSFVVGLDCRLAECDESMVNAFFTHLGRAPSRSVVATSQAVDAVKHLLMMAKIPWSESVDWGGQKAAFQTLPPSHPTRMRRDTLEERRDRSNPADWNLSASDNELIQACKDAIRRQNKAIRTEQSYLSSVRHFLKFVRHVKGDEFATRDIPPDEASAMVGMFLSHLATERGVCANTQATKLNGIVFFFRNVLGIEPGDLDFQRPVREGFLPEVFSANEMRSVLSQLKGTKLLKAKLMYGCGLRVSECIRLRVKDLDFDQGRVSVRQGKGRKDRVLPLPGKLKDDLFERVREVERIWEGDAKLDIAGVYLPDALDFLDSL